MKGVYVLMTTPIVLSKTFVNGQWVSYFPQTSADAIVTSAEKQLVSATQIASWDAAETNAKAYADATVQTAVAQLVNSAPETLDTLGEIAAALQANDSAMEAMLQTIGEKAAKTYVDAQLALKADAAATEQRFTTVEGTVTTLQGDVTANTAAIATKADAATVAGQIADLEAGLATKLEAADVVTVTYGTEAPANPVPGSIFLEVIQG